MKAFKQSPKTIITLIVLAIFTTIAFQNCGSSDFRSILNSTETANTVRNPLALVMRHNQVVALDFFTEGEPETVYTKNSDHFFFYEQSFRDMNGDGYPDFYLWEYADQGVTTISSRIFSGKDMSVIHEYEPTQFGFIYPIFNLDPDELPDIIRQTTVTTYAGDAVRSFTNLIQHEGSSYSSNFIPFKDINGDGFTELQGLAYINPNTPNQKFHYHIIDGQTLDFQNPIAVNIETNSTINGADMYHYLADQNKVLYNKDTKTLILYNVESNPTRLVEDKVITLPNDQSFHYRDYAGNSELILLKFIPLGGGSIQNSDLVIYNFETEQVTNNLSAKISQSLNEVSYFYTQTGLDVAVKDNKRYLFAINHNSRLIVYNLDDDAVLNTFQANTWKLLIL